jgi:hypothetical protein
MSDARDDIARAVALNKKLAAARLVRKEELEAELAALARREAAGEDVAARVAAASDELASVNAEYRAALAEIAELRKLAGRAGAPPVAGLEDDDPLVQSAEDAALDRARAHIQELDAQAQLGGSATPAAPPSKQQADDEARARFEELRAQRGKQPEQANPSGPDEDPPVPPPRKKTM